MQISNNPRFDIPSIRLPARDAEPQAAAAALPGAAVQNAPKTGDVPGLIAPAAEGAQGSREDEIKDMKRLGAIRCATCESRRYQDGSDDSGVSFQTPQHIAPQASIGRVRAHESEHVRREDAKADREDRRVISQTVSIKMATCPECGRSYAAGGITKTVTKTDTRKDAFKDNMKTFMSGHFGNYVDAPSR